jgi:hypothetical protein
MSLIFRSARLAAVLVVIAVMARAPHTIAFESEAIGVFAADCATQKTSFNLGDRVCAVATDAPLGPPVQRRFEWIAPDGTIFQMGPEILSDPQSNSILIPSSGTFAQVGAWTVKTVDVSNNGFAVAQFLVQDQNKTTADLSVNLFAPFQVSAGANVTFTLLVKNNGPNEAQNVQIKISTPGNSNILSAEQMTGPPFTWVVAPQGANATGVSAIETLPVNAEASFAFVYHIDPNTPKGASLASTAAISSDTLERYQADNVATASAIITPQPCTLDCPANIITPKQSGQCGALVSYVVPSATGSNCGALVCNPASGSLFPVGTTSVICVGNTGTPCSFTVTVDDPQRLTITCPPDITVDESSPGMGLAVVKYKSPATNDNCAAETSACTPPSGSSFPLGATTVTCEVSNASGDRIDCSFTVTVKSSHCAFKCPANIARSNKPGECGAVVNYPAPTTEGVCDTVTCAPPSGAFFPIGTTIVSCTSGSDSSGSGSNGSGSSGTFTITIQDTQGPAINNISASPSTLSLFDHKMKDVTINYDSSDNCSGHVTCSLDVSSNESIKGTDDGDISPDWEIIDSRHVRLRDEKTSKGNGRIYTVTITCTDANGNISSKAVTVSVPHTAPRQ